MRLFFIFLFWLFYHNGETIFKCPIDSIDEYYSDPDDCGFFYRCYQKQRQDRFECSPGTLFNQITKNCDWPSRVNCRSSIEYNLAAESSDLNPINKIFFNKKETRLKTNRFENHKIRSFLPSQSNNHQGHNIRPIDRQKQNLAHSSQFSSSDSQNDNKNIDQPFFVTNSSKKFENFQPTHNDHLLFQQTPYSKFIRVFQNYSMVSGHNNHQELNHNHQTNENEPQAHFQAIKVSDNHSFTIDNSQNNTRLSNKTKSQQTSRQFNSFYSQNLTKPSKPKYQRSNKNVLLSRSLTNAHADNPIGNFYKLTYQQSNHSAYAANDQTSASNDNQFLTKLHKPKNTQQDKKAVSNESLLMPSDSHHSLHSLNKSNYTQLNEKPLAKNRLIEQEIVSFNSSQTSVKPNLIQVKKKFTSNVDQIDSSFVTSTNSQPVQVTMKPNYKKLNRKSITSNEQIDFYSFMTTVSLSSENHVKIQKKNFGSENRTTLNKTNIQQDLKLVKSSKVSNRKEAQNLNSNKPSFDDQKLDKKEKKSFELNLLKSSTSKVVDIPYQPIKRVHSLKNTSFDTFTGSNFKNNAVWYQLPKIFSTTTLIPSIRSHSNRKRSFHLNVSHPRFHWPLYSNLNLNSKSFKTFQFENKINDSNNRHHHIHSAFNKNNLNVLLNEKLNLKSHFDSRFPRAADTLHTIEKIYKNDPYSIPDLVKHLQCNETGLKNCTSCKNLGWLKFAKISINSKPNDLIFSSPAHVLRDCFSSCIKINCIAFSFEVDSATCFLFTGPVHVEDVIFNETFTTVIIETISKLIVEEWLYSDSSIPTGKEIAAYPSQTKLTCLRTCITIGDNCKVIAFDYQNKICKAFDKVNGKWLAFQSNHTTLQHRSIHEINDGWRFVKLGANRFNSSQALNTIAIRDDQECFDECLNTKDCVFVSIGGEVFKECQIFNEYLPPIQDTNYQSYFLKLPRDSAPFVEVRDRYFYGRPIAKFNHFDLKNCLEAAKSIKKAAKVSFFEKVQPECQIFGDAAQVGNRSDLVFGARSFKSTLPLDWEYMAFNKAIGVTLSSFQASKVLKHKIEDSSALSCLKLCLEQNCKLVIAHYLENGEQIECEILNEIGYDEDYKFVINKSIDLFARKLSKHDIPKELVEVETNHCSSKLHFLLADENMLEFEKNFNHDRLKKANEEHYIFPHGVDFVGLPETSSPINLNKQKRSLYALLLRGTSLFDQLNQVNSDDIKKAATIAGRKSSDMIKSLDLEKSNDQLLQHFISQIINYDEEVKLDKDLISQLMIAIRKVRQNKNETSPQVNFCRIKRGSVSRFSKCLEEEVCKESPFILYADDEKIKLDCENIRVNSSCQVTCRSGYKPTEAKVTCEQIGKKAVWNTRRVGCVPDENICAQLPWIVFKSDQGLEKNMINYIVKYNINRHLPLYTIYYHGVENSWNSGAEQNVNTVSLPCSQLKGFQMSHLSYKMSNYTKGYLTSPLAFRYSQAAIDSVNYFVNVAPQDPFTKFGPWLVLETKLQVYLKENPGFVISGICPQQQPINSTTPVPKCFWKIVCTKTETGNVTAAAFYHENSIPISANEKRVRVEEVMSYTNPKFISSIIGFEDYNSIWSIIEEKYSELKESEKESQLLMNCKKAEKLEPELVKFWNNILTRPNKGLPWPKSFEDGLVSSNTEFKSPKLTRRSVITNYNSGKCKLKVIGYVGLKNTNFKLSNNSYRVLTHLVLLSSIKINQNGSLSLAQNNQDVYNRIYELKLLKKNNPNLKLLFSIGGWSNSDHFSQIAENEDFQTNFINDIIAFIDYWNVDGIDIIWQYPVIGGKQTGKNLDKSNFVKLLTNIKTNLIKHKEKMSRKHAYLLVMTGSGIEWIIDEGYDLKKIVNVVDWINVMAFDFFGPWNSTWGSYTGPHASLYFGAPDRFPGKMNVESALKKYACETDQIDKLVLGLSFFGRYWNNVEDNPNLSKDELFRKSKHLNGDRGGLIPYSTISAKLKSNSSKFEVRSKFNNKTMTPYIWLSDLKTLISYENEISLKEKVKYAINYGLNGIMIWSLDMDDKELTLFKAIETNLQCPSYFKPKSFKCNPLKNERRYWTQYDGDGRKDRMCGKKAPLINGYYAICDPDNPGYGCCSASGWCGSGPEFCECPDCIDFKANPERVLNESIKPSIPLRWHTLDSKINLTQPICGFNAPLLPNGETPICNPDDSKGHCCSKAGFCGIGPNYCSCDGCINFKVNRNYQYSNRTMFDWVDGPENVKKCKTNASNFRGKLAEYN